MSTNSPVAAHNDSMTWVDYLATSLNMFGLSFLFIIVSLLLGVVETGNSIWRWLMGQNDAEKT